ncbi:flagellar motor switch protein FliN [Halotalea alkalilenta]|uniref:flagellar motor switch protein FliN n=1 Tax=Halotalea alkalilenta TaxID=376489 RepID=UPI000489E7D9|nr:flagellar motor switch protein FliN [Halotalea alkalilenta]
MSDEKKPSEQEELDDIWGEAMAEQQAEPTDDASPPSEEVFKPLQESTAEGDPRDLSMVMDIPVTLSVELGRTRLTIRELLDLAKGSVVELEGLAGEPMDIMINGYLVAQGEVVVIEERYGIRITDIVTPSERLQRLKRRG